MQRTWRPMSEFIHELFRGNDNEENHWYSRHMR